LLFKERLLKSQYIISAYTDLRSHSSLVIAHAFHEILKTQLLVSIVIKQLESASKQIHSVTWLIDNSGIPESVHQRATVTKESKTLKQET